MSPFEQLDYLYQSSRDTAADLRYYEEVLGARVVFAIDGMGARVAMLELGEPPPHLLLADHLEGEAPVLVYRVANLDAAMAILRERGWQGGTRLEIPQGPICSFVDSGGHRLAIYQVTRPQVIESFAGRRDF
ncbi:MAG TPA: hypothetical protein VFY43_04245 [Candidatus Limnocylindria bacterium]|nr:hypothetical protein [Candidatus Limnocylindria bacterium]